MLSCKQSSQIISASLDRQLTTRERLALKLHLLICKYCNRFNLQLQALRVAMTVMTESIECDNKIKMPTAVKNRIAKLVDEHA